MKKVLILVSEFGIGGTMSSLYSLLSVIDPSCIKVDIFSRKHIGPYFKKMPNCTILKENIWLSHTIYERSFAIKVMTKILLGIRKILEPIGIDLYKVYNYIGGKQIHSESYDAVIGFDESMARLVSYFPAKKKINWIHCDYRRFSKGKDESKYYDKIDAVVCVSQFVKGIFAEIYPQYSHKVYAIHNVINVEEIQQKAKEAIDDSRFDMSSYTIVSCGRLDPVKQFSLIPQIAAQLRQKGANPFKWYIIGGGNNNEQKTIEKAIVRERVQDCVLTLGMKENVYPYLANADLYVCTSKSESFPMVINESIALGIPVISNNFPSASESIKDGVNGVVCMMDEIPDYIYRQMVSPSKVVEMRTNENDRILNDINLLLN